MQVGGSASITMIKRGEVVLAGKAVLLAAAASPAAKE